MTAASDQSTAPARGVRMEWTAENIERLRTLCIASNSDQQAADAMGATLYAIRSAKSEFGLVNSSPWLPPPSPAYCAALRSRWEAEMPRLRERVRADVTAIMAEGAAS